MENHPFKRYIFCYLGMFTYLLTIHTKCNSVLIHQPLIQHAFGKMTRHNMAGGRRLKGR